MVRSANDILIILFLYKASDSVVVLTYILKLVFTCSFDELVMNYLVGRWQKSNGGRMHGRLFGGARATPIAIGTKPKKAITNLVTADDDELRHTEPCAALYIANTF